MVTYFQTKIGEKWLKYEIFWPRSLKISSKFLKIRDFLIEKAFLVQFSRFSVKILKYLEGFPHF